MKTRTDNELLAEYFVLEQYDRRRSRLYGDYGNGQRARELARRRNELERRGIDLYTNGLSVPSTDCAAAFERVGRPRLRRARANLNRYRTRPARETFNAWTWVAGYYGRAH